MCVPLIKSLLNSKSPSCPNALQAIDELILSNGVQKSAVVKPFSQNAADVKKWIEDI